MQLTVRMPDEYKSKLSKLTKEMGLKRSDIVRMALKQFIDGNLKKEQRSPFDKVGSLLGTAESGIKDLGQRHREYLIEKIRKAS
ncbi:MAG: CopG family transcriptional regulator [Desulfobacterales bacterium]|nr:CopG family transcriptional regulator [Desulfobacterales bacterium]